MMKSISIIISAATRIHDLQVVVVAVVVVAGGSTSV